MMALLFEESMPYALNSERLDSPDIKMLDIGNPPVVSIPHHEFPKMVYLHPRDKTKEHLTKVVDSMDELDSATAKGWKVKPHIPIPPAVDYSQDFEAEPPAPADDELESKTKAELLTMAKDRGLDVSQQDNKETILNALKGA